MGLRNSLLQLTGIIGISFILTACSNTPVQEPDLPETEYYQEAQKALEQGRPIVAVQHLQDLDTRYPFGAYSQQVKLELIYANYLAGEYADSHAAAESFINTYPDDALLDYAYYYRALSTYKGSENLSVRFLNQDASKRDTTEFIKAFNEFSELLKRYPTSIYNVDAKARMIYLRNNIAKHELHAARYYFKRNAPLAALKRAQTVISDYPSSNSIEDALAIIIQAYTMLEEPTLISKYLNVLKLNYPNSSHLNPQGEFIMPSTPPDVEPSFLYWITLGLID